MERISGVLPISRVYDISVVDSREEYQNGLKPKLGSPKTRLAGAHGA